MRIVEVALVAVLASGCGDGGGTGGGVSLEPGSCPESTVFQITLGGEEREFSVESVAAVLHEDDSLFGDYYEVFASNFAFEPGDSDPSPAEPSDLLVTIRLTTLDQTAPSAGTYDFEDQGNTQIYVSVTQPGTETPLTIFGDGGTVNLTVIDTERVCGELDVDDGTTAVGGSFAADVVAPAG